MHTGIKVRKSIISAPLTHLPSATLRIFLQKKSQRCSINRKFLCMLYRARPSRLWREKWKQQPRSCKISTVIHLQCRLIYWRVGGLQTRQPRGQKKKRDTQELRYFQTTEEKAPLSTRNSGFQDTVMNVYLFFSVFYLYRYIN